MSRNPRSAACRLLVIGAWALTLVWFWLALLVSFGSVAGAMVLWSAIAAPLASTTRDWLARAGTPLPARPMRWLARLWGLLVAVLVLAFLVVVVARWLGRGDDHLSELVFALFWCPGTYLYGGFVATVSLGAMVHAALFTGPDDQAG